jgi:hypothetical protein
MNMTEMPIEQWKDLVKTSSQVLPGETVRFSDVSGDGVVRANVSINNPKFEGHSIFIGAYFTKPLTNPTVKAGCGWFYD